MKTAHIAAMTLAMSVLASAVSAQVTTINRPYQETPPLPLAPAPTVEESVFVPPTTGTAASGVTAAPTLVGARIVDGKIVGGSVVGQPPVQESWEVAMADVTVRQVIEKWSKISGWTFSLEHWTAQRDLPISAQSTFTGNFKSAVRSLLASTELTDMPLQPCFYNNSVLRVVARAEVCDRMASIDR